MPNAVIFVDPTYGSTFRAQLLHLFLSRLYRCPIYHPGLCDSSGPSICIIPHPRCHINIPCEKKEVKRRSVVSLKRDEIMIVFRLGLARLTLLILLIPPQRHCLRVDHGDTNIYLCTCALFFEYGQVDLRSLICL